MRSEEDVNENWCFHLDLWGQGRSQKWFRNDLDLKDWIPVTLPHPFDGPPLQNPGVEGCGWYRRKLGGKRSSPQERWILHFGQSNYSTEVWVNGKHVGSHPHGGYTPFEIDITPALEDGLSQSIAVMVDNVRAMDRCPQLMMCWRNVGGILRDVTLHKTSGGRIESVRLHDAGDGRGPILVAVKTRVSGDGTRLVLNLSGPILNGKPSGRAITRRVEGNPGGETCIELPARYRWSPERPYLFRAVFELRRGRTCVDRKELMAGFRTVGTQGNQFLLNGRPYWVNGINYLFDFPKQQGMIADPRMLEQDLRAIKELGANTIRSHFAMSRRAYELCDELGIMIWHDVPLYWWEDNDAHEGMAAFEAMRAQLPELVEYDYNHPSVVMRLMGNECNFPEKHQQEAIRSICQEARRLDPTRLTSLCGAMQQHEGADLDVDAVVVNLYHRHVKKTIAAVPRETRVCVDALKKVAAHFPDKPIFIAEIGFEGIAHHHGAVYSSEEFQAAAVKEYWKQLTGTGVLSGLGYWCWADYPYNHPRPWSCRLKLRNPSLGNWGIVTEDRRHRKLAYEAVRKCFASKAPAQSG